MKTVLYLTRYDDADMIVDMDKFCCLEGNYICLMDGKVRQLKTESAEKVRDYIASLVTAGQVSGK